jgi:hypothetical protein
MAMKKVKADCQIVVGQKLAFREMTGSERFTRPGARYAESIIGKKSEGVGYWQTEYLRTYNINHCKRNYVIRRIKNQQKNNCGSLL